MCCVIESTGERDGDGLGERLGRSKCDGMIE